MIDQKKPIRVLIVDDSNVSRDLLEFIINSDPDLKVAGFANNGADAIEWLENNAADVITMDIFMPGLDGLQITRRIMETKPIPIVLISSGYTQNDEKAAFKAMEAGALAVLEKPSFPNGKVANDQTREIAVTIKTIAGVKLVRRRSPIIKQTLLLKESPTLESDVQVVAIGASLGGPVALSTILSALPSSFPVPIFIVQHIAAGFAEGFAKWLQGFTNLPVLLPGDGDIARPGFCYIAPSKCHMTVGSGNTIHLDQSAPLSPQPAVSRLLASVASVYGAKAIGVILTGMGRDGVEQLLQMRQAGACTIAQDSESCIMFGMPKEAIAIGAAQHILPLDRIASTLVSLTMPPNKHPTSSPPKTYPTLV